MGAKCTEVFKVDEYLEKITTRLFSATTERLKINY